MAVSFFSSDEYQNEDNGQNSANQRPRKQRTPKLGRKVYPSHDMKRGNGVRRKRRKENCEFALNISFESDKQFF